MLGNFARLTRERTGKERDPANSGVPGPGNLSGETPLGRVEDSVPVTSGQQSDPVTAVLCVETIDLTAPAESIFAALYGNEEDAAWLDGNHASTQASRFTIMGAPTGPNGRVASANTQSGTIRIRHTGRVATGTAGGETIISSGFFDWLEAELETIDVQAPALPFDFQLGWVGYLGYELKAEVGSPNQHHSDLPDASLMFLDRAVVIDHEQSSVYLLALDGLDSTHQACVEWCEQVRSSIQTIEADDSSSNAGTAAPSSSSESLSARSLAARHSHSEYLELIDRVLEKITDGETYEVCLTNMLETKTLEAAGEFDTLSAYLALRADNPTPFGVYLTSKDATVLSTSPERFLHINSDGRVESKPIKGTRARGRTDDEDSAIRKELSHSEKDRSENLMIVDLVRHDLGATAQLGSVAVDKLFDIETYATVHQMVSTVSARLDSAQSPVACVRAAFPPGSMTGAPKLRTMSIIDELEGGPRGVYSGAIGYFSLNGAVDLSVVIRTLVVADDSVRYGVGGAIVAMSEPEDEYLETVAKAAPLLRLFDNAEFPGAAEETTLSMGMDAATLDAEGVMP
nr:aminodeoxychorismate synthase component I [Brevibacterium zhoupengii]